MLDLEVTTGPTHTGLDIVTRDVMKKALRIRAANTLFDDQIDNIIKEIAGGLHGRGGELNRTVFPMTWTRWLRAWPAYCDGRRVIKLPYGPVTSVVSLFYDDGGSPMPEIASSSYVARYGTFEAEIEFKANVSLPSLESTPRAIGITYRAGYATYPDDLKRLVKILVAHAFENPEATINEPRQMAVNRKVAYGADWLMARLKVPVSYDDWE